MKTEYSGQRVIDFLEKDSFVKWAVSTPSSEYDQWEIYFIENPGLQTEMLAARQFVLDIKISEGSDKALEEQIWKNIKRGKSRIPGLFKSAAFRVAASLVLLLSFFSYLYTDNPGKSEKYTFRSEKNEAASRIDAKSRQELPDGTTIVLSPDSKISYPDNYNETERIVYLEGEAFFDVVRNPEKPFYVISDDFVTKVLGTSFLVTAKKGSSENSVSVKTGKVEVMLAEAYEDSWLSKKAKGKIQLEPNQKAIYSKLDNSFSKTLVETPVQIERQAIQLNFDNSPSVEVLSKLSKAFGVEIYYNPEIFKNCLMTVNLEQEKLYESLDIICKTLNANYHIEGTRIIIEGKGCKF